MKRRIDILTSAIARPLLTESIQSFMSAFADRSAYHVRWIYHLDRYPGLERHHDDSFMEAVRVSSLFDDASLFNAHRNIGYIASVKRLLSASTSAVVFAEDDWIWKGEFCLLTVEKEVKERGKFGYNFRNPIEYLGAFGCCYMTRPPLETLLRWWRLVKSERHAKRVLRHGHKYYNVIEPSTRLQRYDDMCFHLGPQWARENNYAGRID